MKYDPYLVPGWPCEVWHSRDSYIELAYFYRYDSAGYPLFIDQFYRGKLDVNSNITAYRHYHPMNTEWDFAPPWAVCSTVDEDGMIEFWPQESFEWFKGAEDDEKWDEGCWWDQDLNGAESSFLCPDKTRYENGAWKKTSMRVRPVWAGGER